MSIDDEIRKALAKLPKCAVLTCVNKADPRWYAKDVNGRVVMICDGHDPGPSPTEVVARVVDRAAQRADKEHVRQVVREALEVVHLGITQGQLDSVADRVAEQLAVRATSCDVHPFSSRMCERGTKGCVVEHASVLSAEERTALERAVITVVEWDEPGERDALRRLLNRLLAGGAP